MPMIACTAPPVAACNALTWAAMPSVALAVCVARPFTSDATTAKLFPASPARAASIVAFNASRLVWLAILLIRLTTSPIFCAASARPWIVALVRSAAATAAELMSVERVT